MIVCKCRELFSDNNIYEHRGFRFWVAPEMGKIRPILDNCWSAEVTKPQDICIGIYCVDSKKEAIEKIKQKIDDYIQEGGINNGL